MSLAAGRSLSHYRLIEPLGEGGMGVVWKASDATLGRDVAIKVLPDLFAADPERLARFEREARLLAALNHPHIASIYGLHDADGVRFLAMELVEGENLAMRIARGPLPLAEALPLALQIAQALEHAHEKGVIHRDLKPANVVLTASGQAKVLDFGLAKALEGDVARPASASPLSQSPTITQRMTGANVLLGTAAYMAPEQARGHLADRRADIWAFGVVLIEMLSGRRLFEGETISDTLASVLKTDPDWSRLPAETPARIRTLLRRCLERDPRRRLRDIGEARFALEETIAGVPDESATGATPAPAPRSRVPGWALLAAGLVAGAALTYVLVRAISPPAAATPVKFRLARPAGGADAPAPIDPVIAPDGRAVAFLAGGKIWIQSLAELEPRALDAEVGAARPFWSPDGRHVGYIAGTRILRVSVASGETQAVCDTRGVFTGGQGASWGADGTIVFSRGDSLGLQQVSARGGDPRPLLRPDSAETDLHEPHVLPGGRGILFAAHRVGAGYDNLWLWSRGRRKRLLHLPGQNLSNPCYSPTGHILFRRAPVTTGIWAVPFSLARLECTGDPFLVVPNAMRPSVSRDGTLAYSGSDPVGALQMLWVDRGGREIGTIGSPQGELSRMVSLAPNGIQVAGAVTEGDNEDIWIHDTVRGTRTRLTFAPADDQAPSWSPDGARIAYHTIPPDCASPECLRVVVRAADGTGVADTVVAGGMPIFTPDGRSLTFLTFRGGVAWNLALLPLSGERTPRLLVRGSPRVADGRVRPSGDLMAYASDESGHWEVYLTRFPSAEGRWQVSVAGGMWPHWNARGDRLYFAQGEDLMEVEVGGTGSPVLSTPRRLFTRPALGTTQFEWYTGFDVTRDGSRFVILRPVASRGPSQGVTVVQNWSAEFAERR